MIRKITARLFGGPARPNGGAAVFEAVSGGRGSEWEEEGSGQEKTHGRLPGVGFFPPGWTERKLCSSPKHERVGGLGG